MITFQEAILRLQTYWNQQGCALLQPIDMEVGAGTSNTATFLRALGPEPWHVAYVEPSRRPTDGALRREPEPPAAATTSSRSSSSPRRPTSTISTSARSRARHRPGAARRPLRRGRLGEPDARRLGPRLGGVDGRHGDHPVHLLPAGRRPRLPARSPARSRTASSASRCTCRTSTTSTTSCGPTGRPRCQAALTYGDVLPPERGRAEHVQLRARRRAARCFRQFDVLRGRGEAPDGGAAARCPAYEKVLKAAHTFNLLDARGAIRVTERAAYIGRIRTLARAIAQSYYESRERARLPDASARAARGEAA